MPDPSVILVVDDDSGILRCVSDILATAGFKAQVANDGEEGLECFHKHRHELCLVLTDIVMPKMNGLDMGLRICKIDPSLPVLLMSGYADSAVEEEGRKAFPFIRKPFLAGNLIGKIREVMGDAH